MAIKINMERPNFFFVKLYANETAGRGSNL